jgi:hypothetical protein
VESTEFIFDITIRIRAQVNGIPDGGEPQGGIQGIVRGPDHLLYFFVPRQEQVGCRPFYLAERIIRIGGVVDYFIDHHPDLGR